MKNKEIADIFYQITDYLETKQSDFRSNAYRKAAQNIEALEEDIGSIYERGGIKALQEIPGVGKNISEKIEEYLKTGRVKAHERLKKELPIDLAEMMEIEGMGPRKAKILYQSLGIKSLKELEKAAKGKRIASLPGFGEKTERNILEGLEFLKRSKGRFLLGEIYFYVEDILKKLGKIEGVQEISVAGSLRRMKETIGDVDILVASRNRKRVAEFFCSLPGVVKIWGKGSTKCSVRVKNGFDMDLRIVGKKSFGSALQYFTGSKDHNIALRRIAISKKMKLSEYGLFKKDKLIAGASEKSIYKALGLDWIEPELREDRGEVEAALKGVLPKIIRYDSLRGSLHCHSSWNGGENSVADLAKEAQQLGYEYLGISDHTKFLRIENGLDEKALLRQRKEIDKLNDSFGRSKKRFRLLQGAETNILNNGSLDIKDEALERLDFAVAGIHSSMKMPEEKMTERIIAAMKNPNINILSHPTGRILKRRDEYQCDFDKILRAAKEYNVALEINAYPVRLDLNDRNIRRAKEAGVKMVINPDAHQKNQLAFVEFGIAQARRGWAEEKDIINTWPLVKLLKYLKHGKT